MERMLYCATAMVVATMGVVGSAHAQQAGTSTGLEDIVVTAQRREERLQDVPIAVSAVTANQLAQRGISDIRTLTQSVPGLAVVTQGSVATPYLRGVGSNGADPNNEPSIASYVDGVYISAPFANIFALNNVERVEVLKGPQGTLFGRNATGGVVQVITRTPSHDSVLEGSVGYANYNEISAAGYASTGLGESAAIDLAAVYKNQMDGYGRNLFLNEDIYKKKELVLRSKLLIEPSDRTKITIAGDYGYNWNSLVEYQMAPGVRALNGQVNYRGKYRTNNSEPGYSYVRQYGVSARIEQDLSFARLTSISAYRRSRGAFVEDADGSPASYIYAILPQRNRMLSQELQLGANAGSAINWLIGGFLYDSKASYDKVELSGSLVGATKANPILVNGAQHTKSASVYGQVTAEVLPATNLTGGLRYTDEKQTFESSAGGFVAPPGSQKFGKWTWRVSLDHKFTEQVLAYVSYNHGIKSGGFDLLTTGGKGYKPEQIDAYEVGLKTELFDRKLRFNVSAFYYDYTDIQVQTFRVAASATENAAGAHVKGIDFDFEFRPVPGLTIGGGLGYLDSKYTDYPSPALFPQSPLDPPFTMVNAKGNRTTRAPEWTGNLAATYSFDTSAGRFAINGSVYHNDGFYFDAANRVRQPSYTLVSASLDWTEPSGHFGVNLWVRNLTKALYYDQFATTAYGDLFAYAEPRRFGATLRYKM